MDEHQKFLADRLLSEGLPVSYRGLSRALNVHVNTAKGMLHDFYEYQNGVRPKSVSATYLILGHASAAGRSSNHDIEMSSSMPESEDVYNAASARILTLVKEEALSATLQLYQNVTSIHIYSLAPSSVNDLSYLVDETKSLRVETSSGLEQQKTFEKLGVIFNPHLRLREQKGQTVSNAPATFKAPSKGMFQKDKMKAEAIETPFKGPASTPTASGKNVKRDFAGAIHKSFAKSVMKPSVKKKAAIKEDEHETALSSDGEADDSDIMPSANAKQPDSRTKSRKEREDELRRMMEEDAKDNSGEDNSSDSSEKDPALSDTHKEDQQAPAVSEQPEAKMSAEAEVSEVVSSTGDGRRRGKRRVMKKKRILDDHGYMVTIQEPAWESFSEDETDQPPPKKQASSSTPSSSAPKVKKGTSKGAQGSIMSFFAKK